MVQNIWPEYFVLVIAKSRNTAIIARTWSNVFRDPDESQNPWRRTDVEYLRVRKKDLRIDVESETKKRACEIHRRHLTLIAS